MRPWTPVGFIMTPVTGLAKAPVEASAVTPMEATASSVRIEELVDMEFLSWVGSLGRMIPSVRMSLAGQARFTSENQGVR
jgi:hypothetical protein